MASSTIPRTCGASLSASILHPGDDGYDEAAATAIPLDRHPLLGPDDDARDAELEALFRAWDVERASA